MNTICGHEEENELDMRIITNSLYEFNLLGIYRSKSNDPYEFAITEFY